MRTIIPLALCLCACAPGDTDRGSVAGQVLRRDGAAVGGARVTIDGKGATSDGDGRFAVSGLAHGAALARVDIAGERAHHVPVATGSNEARLVIPDAPAEGAADLWLAGDVMFSRRYLDPDGDGDRGDAIVSPDDPEGGALAVLQHVSPLMKDADLAVVNLETVVTDAGFIHPRKPYTLRSDPGVLGALSEAGVGLLGLANNHVYDYTDEGLSRMIELIDQAGLPRVGAGRTYDEAVEPRIVTINGLKIAIIAATSITGRPYIDAGDADGDGDAFEGDNLPPYYTAENPDFTGGVDRPGAMRLQADYILESIRRANAAGAEMTILLAHGGTQYSKDESPFIRKMAYLAIDHGVDLVVGHHPHVIQGIEVYKGVPIVYSVGNLAFDQQFIETFPALVVEARLVRGRPAEVAVRPIFLDGYSPRALVGASATRVLRDVAARSAGLGATLEIDAAAGRAVVRGTEIAGTERTVEVGGAFLPGRPTRTLPQALPGGFVTRIEAPAGVTVDLGRPLLVDGSFEDGRADTDDDPVGWTLVGSEKKLVRETGAPAELRLARSRNSAEDSTARSTGRLPIAPGTRLTLMGRFRRDTGAGRAIARIAIYADRETGSLPVAVAEARGAREEWRDFSVDLIAPPGALYAQVQLVHAPPATEAGEVAFENIELLEWSGARASGGIAAAGATHVALEGGTGTGAATIELSDTPKVKAWWQ